MSKLLKEANAVKVDPELMETILEEVANRRAEDRDFVGTSILIARLVSELGLPERERLDMGVAVNFRFLALARLMDEGGGRGWTIPVREEGYTLIPNAAEEPMIEVGEEVRFDPESFQRRVLALAEMQGEA